MCGPWAPQFLLTGAINGEGHPQKHIVKHPVATSNAVTCADFCYFFFSQMPRCQDAQVAHVWAVNKAHVNKAHVLAPDKAHVLAPNRAHVLALNKAHVLAPNKAHVLAPNKAHVMAPN